MENPSAMDTIVEVAAVRKESNQVAGAQRDCTSVQNPVVVQHIPFKNMANDANPHPLATRFGLGSMLNKPL
jgi:hypothetical protein